MKNINMDFVVIEKDCKNFDCLWFLPGKNFEHYYMFVDIRYVVLKSNERWKEFIGSIYMDELKLKLKEIV